MVVIVVILKAESSSFLEKYTDMIFFVQDLDLYRWSELFILRGCRVNPNRNSFKSLIQVEKL